MPAGRAPRGRLAAVAAACRRLQLPCAARSSGWELVACCSCLPHCHLAVAEVGRRHSRWFAHWA
eukprot:15453956-Alexandrium_andersonii.AAC.1